MRAEEFASSHPGRLVSAESGYAFIPDFLPPKVDVTLPMLRAAGAARGALGEFVGESKRVKNERLIMYPLMMREAVESNRIEGTFTEIEGVLFQKVAGPPLDPLQASNQRDVINYLDTIDLGNERIAEGWPLTQILICALHKKLLRGSSGGDTNTGTYRLRQVYIGRQKDGIQGARFVPPPPEQVQPSMDNFFAFIGGETHSDPLIDCAVMHYQFETIHPFEDGNGRLGRLLIPLYLRSKGILTRPDLYLSSFFEARKDEYIDLMKNVSTRNEWSDWVLFFLEAVGHQANESKSRVQNVIELREKYLRSVTDSSSSQAALLAVDLVMEKVYVTVPQLAQFSRCSYPASKTALGILEELGVIEPIEGRYPRTWIARELLNKIYKK